jgi:hypothetical protein
MRARMGLQVVKADAYPLAPPQRGRVRTSIGVGCRVFGAASHGEAKMESGTETEKRSEVAACSRDEQESFTR